MAEISDESLWQLFETSGKESSPHSILNITQSAAEAVSNKGASDQTSTGADTQSEKKDASVTDADVDSKVTAEPQNVDPLEEFTPHMLDTVLEESSRELTGVQDSRVADVDGPVSEVKSPGTVKDTSHNSATSNGGIVRMKATALKEIKSPFDPLIIDQPTESTTPKALSRDPVVVMPVQLSPTVLTNQPIRPNASYPQPIRSKATYPPPISVDYQETAKPRNHFQPITDGVTSRPDPMGEEYTGSIPGGFYVTVEKHTTDDLPSKHMTSTPHSVQSARVMVTDAHHTGNNNIVGNDSSSSCQSSFDIPKPQSSPDSDNVRLGERLPTMKQGRGPNMYPNPQLMAQDVQVKHYDLSQRQQAVRNITAKQAEVRVHRNKYSVPVTRVTSAHELKTASSPRSLPPQQSVSAPLLTSQNITVQHELVASDFVSSLLERLMGREATTDPTKDDGAELREIKALERKLQATESELGVVKQQMSQQQRDDQNKLLSELVYSQRTLQNQLQSLRTTATATTGRGGSLEDLFKTPAPRSRLPAAAQLEESPAGGFMEQVVRSYPSPVSPQKQQAIQRSGAHTPPTRLSPVPILKNSPKRSPALSPSRQTDRRKDRVEEETSRQLQQLNDKVQKLMDEQRMDALNVQKALLKEAPIDRYLTDIKLVREEGGQSAPAVLPEKDRNSKGSPHDILDATFLLQEPEPSLTDQLKKKLDKLQQRQRQVDENMATVVAMRARGSYLNTDDIVCDEDTRIHKLVQAHLDRAEADVQRQVSQIDFLPKPLHDRNAPTNQQSVRYRTTAERLKAVRAKVDTGIARKPLLAGDKENEMEPVDLTKDDNYMRRVYGKALYHAQRRTVEKAKPDSPTRPLPYKTASGKRVRSEKVQVEQAKRKPLSKGTVSSQRQSQVQQPSKHVAGGSTTKPAVRTEPATARRTVATGISEPAHLTPTTILGSGMRIGAEDPTKMILDVLPLPQSDVSSEASAHSDGAGAQPPSKQTARDKRSAVTVDKVESPFVSSASEAEGDGASNINNNAKSPVSSDSKGSQRGGERQRGDEDSTTSEWQESEGNSTSRPQLMMTADSLDLSAVTPAVDGQRSGNGRSKGQAHSTPVEQQVDQNAPMREKQQVTADPPPRAWEEFEEDPEARGASQEDKSRSDDIITPPTVLPGYQYRKAEQAPAVRVLQTPVTRPRDLFSAGDRQQEVGGASRYPREQWEVDPVVEKPLYDPTEMATRDWLEQRLMAKCIERMIKEYPVRRPVGDPTHGQGGDDSESHSVDNQLVAGALAEGGAAQVYVDAGKPIDTEQVRRVMKECLADKIRTMLGTREMLDRVPGDVTRVTGQSAQVIERPVQSEVALDSREVEQAVLEEPTVPAERVPTPERTPPSTPVEPVVTRLVAETPEPSPPSTPRMFTDVVSKPLDSSLRSTDRRPAVDTRSSVGRMPTTPFDLHRQQSQPLEDDEVRIEQEVVPPTPAAPVDTPEVADVAKSQDEKLHLSQVSLWDTLSAAHTQDSAMDETPPFERRYSIDTPEPTPPPSPPQAVSVQTSLTEQVLEAKLRASAADNGAEDAESRQHTPVPATRTSRPHTPLRSPSAQSQLIQVEPVPSPVIHTSPVQSHVIHVAPSQSEPGSPESSTTVTDTQMNTVSEGEWILKSDGQITPRGEATLADLSLVSSDDETEPVASAIVNREVKESNGRKDEESHSEGEIIGPSKTDPIVALLARVQETPKVLKSWRPGGNEEGEHIIISSPSVNGSGARSRTEVDNTMRMSDLNGSSKVKRQLLPAENNQSSSSSTGLAFADSKQVTVKPRHLQEVVASAAEERLSANQKQASYPMRRQDVAQPAYSISPNKATKGSSSKRPIPGMIQSTLDNKRKSRPTSSLRTTEDFSQLSNTASANFSRTRDSVDSPDRMHTESLLRSGGYLSRTLGDTTSELSDARRPESATIDTNQLLARTIDSQGLSTGTSTAMLDTNKLLADTLEQQADLYQRHLMRQPRTSTLRSEVINEDQAMRSSPLNVNESVDSVSSGGILRSSNEYTRTFSGAANRPRQYLRFSVPTGDDDSSQASDDISELDF